MAMKDRIRLTVTRIAHHLIHLGMYIICSVTLSFVVRKADRKALFYNLNETTYPTRNGNRKSIEWQ